MTSTEKQVDALSQLLDCYGEIERLSLRAPRPSTATFCDINENGCRKFRKECNLIGENGTFEQSNETIKKDLPTGCRQKEGSAWCSPEAQQNSTPWGIPAVPKEQCRLPILCRAHTSPCCYYGCVTKRDVQAFMGEKVPEWLCSSLAVPSETTWGQILKSAHLQGERVQEEARRNLCPYSNGALAKSEFPLLQCYLTSEKFRRFQTEQLGLYTGLYAFYDVFADPRSPRLLYCLQEPYSSLQFPFYEYDGSKWITDDSFHYKQYVARYMRMKAERGAASFYDILNDPLSSRLSRLEIDMKGVLYVRDGEFSAFILGCILRMMQGLESLANTIDPWSVRLLLTIPRDLQNIFHAIGDSFKQEEILPVKISLRHLFQLLGLLSGTGVPTERMRLLVYWLFDALTHLEEWNPLFRSEKNPESEWVAGLDASHQELLSRLRDAIDTGVENLDFQDIRVLSDILLSNGEPVEAFGSRSRVGYENLFAHLVWRRNSFFAKSWIVIPLHSFPFRDPEDHNKQQVKQVAFFLGTFKDTDAAGKLLCEEALRSQISAIRLVARAAAKDFENLFLRGVLDDHINQLLSTPGPQIAHDIGLWISDRLDPALAKLKIAYPDDQATKKLSLHRRELDRLRSVVRASIGRRTLSQKVLTKEYWEQIETAIKAEICTNPQDEITFAPINTTTRFCTDRDVLETILLRLVSNSLIHGRKPSDGRAVVKVLVDEKEDDVEITVWDEGPGYDLITERGKRRPRYLTEDGMGSALRQVEQLAKLHGGTVEFDYTNPQVPCGAKTIVKLRTTMVKK